MMELSEVEDVVFSLIELCMKQALTLADLSERWNALEQALKIKNPRLYASWEKNLEREKKKSAEHVARVEASFVRLRNRASRISN